MKKTLKFLIFGCIALALTFTSCSNDDEALAIGDFHEGGIIFYLDGTGQHGLVCAVSDLKGQTAINAENNVSFRGAEWGCPGTEINGADGKAIGTGSQNTRDIIAGCTTGETAADLCANLTLNSYSDWFLPSIDELNEMFLKEITINAKATANGGTEFSTTNHTGNWYWSSTELDLDPDGIAWIVDFVNGHTSRSKGANLYVRAVRAF